MLYKTATNSISINFLENLCALTARNKEQPESKSLWTDYQFKLSRETEIVLFRSLGVLIEDEGRYNRLRQKAVQ
jgi:hypothetical protein